MRGRFAITALLALSLGACSGPRAPLNPPRLIMSGETDLTIQLFMQSTILLARYYGYETIRYADIQARSARGGFNAIPFMPPETVRATPELVNFFNKYTGDFSIGRAEIERLGGYKVLVKYYIRTGLRASQSICRNYLLGLEERNAYLEFLQKEFGIASTLASGILLLVNANNTLTQGFLLGITGTNAAIDAYQEFRFLNIDREAALILVETAQNRLAEHYMMLVDKADQHSTVTAGGYTFSDALRAVSIIEYQCTRSGIRSLLTRSIANSPSNLMVDDLTGTFQFLTSKQETTSSGESVDSPPRPKQLNAAPPLSPAASAPQRVVVAPPPGVLTPVRPPGVVTALPPAPETAASPADRIRAFSGSSTDNRSAVQEWLRRNGIGGPIAGFLAADAQENNRARMVNELRIP